MPSFFVLLSRRPPLVFVYPDFQQMFSHRQSIVQVILSRSLKIAVSRVRSSIKRVLVEEQLLEIVQVLSREWSIKD